MGWAGIVAVGAAHSASARLFGVELAIDKVRVGGGEWGVGWGGRFERIEDKGDTFGSVVEGCVLY